MPSCPNFFSAFGKYEPRMRQSYRILCSGTQRPHITTHCFGDVPTLMPYVRTKTFLVFSIPRDRPIWGRSVYCDEHFKEMGGGGGKRKKAAGKGKGKSGKACDPVRA